MLRFDQRSGTLSAVLLDRGYLTDLRTAAAGAVVAQYLAPAGAERVGILGTGVQARLQVQLLREVVRCTRVVAWGRNADRLAAYAADMRAGGFDVETVTSPAEVAAACRLLVTTTASRAPLLTAAMVRPGTHVTAVGADAPGKQELATDLFAKADRVVVDSLAQCADHGDLAHAICAGAIAADGAAELGAVIAGAAPGRRSDDEITVCDLTGVAVQDVVAAEHVWRAGERGTPSPPGW
jgi:ornithine cyclodeaminase